MFCTLVPQARAARAVEQNRRLARAVKVRRNFVRHWRQQLQYATRHQEDHTRETEEEERSEDRGQARRLTLHAQGSLVCCPQSRYCTAIT